MGKKCAGDFTQVAWSREVIDTIEKMSERNKKRSQNGNIPKPGCLKCELRKNNNPGAG